MRERNHVKDGNRGGLDTLPPGGPSRQSTEESRQMKSNSALGGTWLCFKNDANRVTVTGPGAEAAGPSAHLERLPAAFTPETGTRN